MTSHGHVLMTLALEVADRALVLVHGEVALDCQANELRTDPTIVEAAYFGAGATTPSPIPASGPRGVASRASA